MRCHHAQRLDTHSVAFGGLNKLAATAESVTKAKIAALDGKLARCVCT